MNLSKTPNRVNKPSMYVLQTPQSQLTLSAELRNIINDKNMLTTRTRHKVLSALDDISKNDDEEKQQSLRLQSIKEILTSEVSYLYQLELIIKYFMIPIIEKEFLSNDHFVILFGHIEEIYKVNGELLAEMKKNVFNVAAAFFKLAPYFKLYSVYAYDYKNVMTLLQQLEVSNIEFSTWLKGQEHRPEVQSRLSALLIAPIQRVPRYRLLLIQVLQYTPEVHDDYALLQDTLRRIESTVVHIENQMKEQEQTEAIMNLQTRLHNKEPRLVKPGRRLIKEDGICLLTKFRSNYRKSSRYLALMTDVILICRYVRMVVKSNRNLQADCLLPLNKCHVEKISEAKFRIICLNENFLFECKSAAGCDSWISTLQESIKRYVLTRQTLRKDSSTRQPCKGKRLKGFGKESEENIIRRLDKENEEPIKNEDICESDSSEETSSICFPIPKCNKNRKKTSNAVSAKNVTCEIDNSKNNLSKAGETKKTDEDSIICSDDRVSKRHSGELLSQINKKRKMDDILENEANKNTRDILYPLRSANKSIVVTKYQKDLSERQMWLQRYNRILKESINFENQRINNSDMDEVNNSCASDIPDFEINLNDSSFNSTLDDSVFKFSDISENEVYVFNAEPDTATNNTWRSSFQKLKSSLSDFGKSLRNNRLMRLKR